MTREELHAAIRRDIDQRTSWENRQSQLYKGRYRGLRRTTIPFPGASDINWPLVDGIIDKIKPVYFGQLFATELLATFFPTAEASGAAAQLATAAAQWFDFRLKQESNLEHELLHVIDSMLMLDRPCLKTVWDASREQVRFVTVQPGHIIVPASTRTLEEADRVVHVLHFTPEGYRRQAAAGFKQGEDFIKKLTGKGPDRTAGDGTIRTEHVRREGITDGTEDQIVVWEVWTQDDDRQWRYECFSPTCCLETIKPEVKNPYEHGGHPFVDFPYEVTQSDWLAPRGLCEIILPFQAQLTKLLNEQNDATSFLNRPLFVSERDVPNPLNQRFHPGQILPFGIKPAAMAAPPVDWERQMMLMRDIAERHIMVPDYGMQQMPRQQHAKTATEIEQMAAVTQQSADLRMRIFRMSLGRVFAQAWAILRQYARKRLAVWVEDALVNIPPEALAGTYSLRPSGSADGVTRQQLWRKAVARLQMFTGDPFINQGELRKSVLEADDSGLVKRLFADPNITAATQAEDQIVELGIMTLGHPALVTEADDHAAHLRAVLHYLQNLNQTQARPSPLGFQLMYAHVMQHLEALRKKDPAMAKQAEDAFAVVLQGMAAAQQQAQAQIPGANGAAPAGSPAVPGPGAGAPPLVQAPGPGRGVSPTTTSNPSYRVYPAST